MADIPSALAKEGNACTQTQATLNRTTAGTRRSISGSSGSVHNRIAAAWMQTMRCTLTCRRSMTPVSSGWIRKDAPVPSPSRMPDCVFVRPRWRK